MLETSMSMSRVYYGPVANPVNPATLDLLPNTLLAVTDDGLVAWLEPDVQSSMIQHFLTQHAWTDAPVLELNSDEWLMPGFVDTHTHAPQFPNIGRGQQYQLLDWLEKVTFPTEAAFSNPEYAKAVYPGVISTTIQHGTTTCCYYGTLHPEATKLLADYAHQAGQRAFIGKCNMDSNCPPTYIESSPDMSIRDTKEIISYIRSLGSNRIYPVVTPRFAISCSPDLLTRLGGLIQSDPTLTVQTHISENLAEIELTKKLFPSCTSYADVYDSFGLLRQNTILAHAIHLTDEETLLIRQRGSGISHCPTSNLNLRSGCANVGKYLDLGIKVGLGTDCSGGYSPSILTAMQHASIVSKILAMQAPNASFTGFEGKQLPVSTLVYLATLGGAQVCNLDQHIGSFQIGKSFDALLISMMPPLGGYAKGITKVDQFAASLERFLFQGDEKNISTVWVQGKVIGGTRYRLPRS